MSRGGNIQGEPPHYSSHGHRFVEPIGQRQVVNRHKIAMMTCCVSHSKSG